MYRCVKYLSSACVGALLLACADHAGLRELPKPPAQVAAAADDAYLLGRQQHLARRFAAARDHYQVALRADPRHVNARNGLAMLYAEQGDMAKAIALWRGLTAASAGPVSAFLYSNLGYALLLNGEYATAASVLERACVLDPLNPRAWHHLGSALENSGQAARAQRMYQQASALGQHDFKAEAVLAQRGVAATAATPDGWAVTEVRQTNNGMFELRRLAPAAVVPARRDAGALATVASAAAQALPATRVKLEVRNGCGIAGMARRVARQMDDASLRLVRLSNEKRFNVAHTRVEYTRGFRQSAQRLAEHFGNVALLEVAHPDGADVLLVIGRDWLRSKAEVSRLSTATVAPAGTAI